jgi:uncharacterized protein YggL (DUF469 family)
MDSSEPWLGFSIIYSLDPQLRVSEQDRVNATFLTQAIEKNGLFYHGGGRTPTHGFANAQYPTSATQAQRQAVAAWPAGHPGVLEFEIGSLEIEPPFLPDNGLNRALV